MSDKGKGSNVTLIDVIGGSGFIGTRLIRRLLARGDVNVRIIDKQPSASFPELVHLCDVRDTAGLRQVIRSGSTIVNLAAEHRDDVRPVSLYFEVNVEGARNVCRVATEVGCHRIIFTSSVAVYGRSSELEPADETSPLQPTVPYGESKAAAEAVYKEWQAGHPEARSLQIVRPTVVFGDGNRGNIYQLMRAIYNRKFLMIGDGSNVKSICYVDNCASFLETRLAAPAGVEIFNYVDKPDLTMRELVNLIAAECGVGTVPRLPLPMALAGALANGSAALSRLAGRRPIVTRERLEKFAMSTAFATRAFELGFSPEIPLEKALAKTIQAEIAIDGFR
ncbi:NAD-dependent epimerase/dehydratase family protein [Thermaurantiacus sp.]